MYRCSGQRQLTTTVNVISGPTASVRVNENPSVDFTCSSLNYLVKYFTDNVTITENLTFDSSKYVIDNVDITEATYLNITKPFTEDLTPLEHIYLQVSKPFTEVFTVTDYATIDLYKYNIENITMISSGESFLHSYVEIDYFTGTYIGTLQQFT